MQYSLKRDKMKRKITPQEYMILLAAVSIILFTLNYVYLQIDVLYMTAIAVLISGPAFYEYRKFKINRAVEARFPDFIRDVSENIRAGMTLTQAVKATKTNEYGYLSKDVRRMAVHIDWGIPFEDILQRFSRKYSKAIQRNVSTIIEAYRGGGNIANILDSSAKSIYEINKIKKERVSNVYSQVVTGYIIFFVFLGVLYSISKMLVPALGFSGSGLSSFETFTSIYNQLFMWLIIIQGFFSGLVIGKLSEGAIISGLKHSIILVFIGYGSFVLIM